jgi:hypothetical protein
LSPIATRTRRKTSQTTYRTTKILQSHVDSPETLHISIRRAVPKEVPCSTLAREHMSPTLSKTLMLVHIRRRLSLESTLQAAKQSHSDSAREHSPAQQIQKEKQFLLVLKVKKLCSPNSQLVQKLQLQHNDQSKTARTTLTCCGIGLPHPLFKKQFPLSAPTSPLSALYTAALHPVPVALTVFMLTQASTHIPRLQD